jgi:uncharacterized protein YndB with AHSA1/START domain
MKQTVANKPTTSDEAVAAKTGKTWAEWFKVLDAAGAKKMDHKSIVAILDERHPEIGGWWMQMVTVTYEQARGLRAKHEKPSGFEVSASKTIEATLSSVYHAWTDKKICRRWLSDASFTIRRATTDKSLRITWNDESHVNVMFYAKGEGKTQVTVQHGKLKNATAARQMQSYWKERLEQLKNVLEKIAA